MLACLTATAGSKQPYSLCESFFFFLMGERFFWYQPTWVVPDKGLLNGCVCVLLHFDADENKNCKIRN